MKRIILVILSVFMLISCTTSNYGQLAQGLNLGMTKTEVLAIMGNNYIVENLSNTSDGKIEAILYNNYVYSNSDYIIVFLNNRLVEVNNVPRAQAPQQNITVTKDSK